MSDSKRNAREMLAMEASSEATSSKKTKTSADTCELQSPSSNMELRNTHLLEGWQEKAVSSAAVSSATSLNSAGTVVSDEFCSDQFPPSCCSSNEISEVVKGNTTLPDLEAKGLDTVDSTDCNIKLFRDCSHSWREFSGHSEDASFPAKSLPPSVTEHRELIQANMPPKAEIEEFFAMAEKYEQKRFAEKYNYDIVKDMPLEGRFQWLPLHSSHE